MFPAEALQEASAAIMHNSVDAIEASAAADADELHDLTGDDVGLIQQISSNSHDVQCDV